MKQPVLFTSPARPFRTSTGCGAHVIEDSLPYMLGGTSRLNFNPDGVECVMAFPLPKSEAVGGASGLRNSNMPVSLDGS